MAKQVVVNPEADLEARDSDIPLRDEQFLKISLFANLKRKPSLDKYPGAKKLRRYRKGEVICRQGEAGWTAFYILTTEDELAMREDQLKEAKQSREVRDLQAEINRLRQRVQQLQDKDQTEELRKAVTVQLSIARVDGQDREGWLRRLTGGVLGGGGKEIDPGMSITIDARTEIDSRSLQATMREGELFGEMSCLYRTPRSATIVANHDCCIVEMLRNIFDQLQKDAAYKAEIDKHYKDRVLRLHLRKLPLFRDLTEEQYEQIRSDVDLVSYEPGQLICDEHERSDCMYIVRSGLVKVVKKGSALLSKENIRSWQGLTTALKEEAAQPATPVGKIFQLLPAAMRTAFQTEGSVYPESSTDRNEILYALNDIIKEPKTTDLAELKPLAAKNEFIERVKELPQDRKQWTVQDRREYNRHLMELAFGSAIRTYRRRVGPECILTYCSQGESIGEMGLMEGQPRSASCVAHGHPGAGGKDTGTVELVRISQETFRKLVKSSSTIRRRLDRLIAERRKRTEEMANLRVDEESESPQLNETFQQLGLLQGQRLMLIDLDRCTRCDECVRACVNTHTDGRSRLYLDGPRFGKYLVPTTCRSCLDPLCLIGCPVSSIHRGDNGEIQIENWCIGCGLCSNQCPYGAIVMHDIGVLPEGARGWRYAPAVHLEGKNWQRRRFRDKDWKIGDAPFHYDRAFYLTLAGPRPDSRPAHGQPVCFRIEFRLASHLLRTASHFRLEAASVDPAALVWINGQELHTEEKAKRGKREFQVPAASGADRTPLRAGSNLLAVQVTPGTDSNEVLLAVRLDAVFRPRVVVEGAEEVSEKLVTERAVVCDLCSAQWGQRPACVTACPHDAAMRVDARFDFPVR